MKRNEIFEKYPLVPGMISGYSAACTGNKYCSFAPIETKYRLSNIIAELENRFPDLKYPVRINLTGCIHSCAHAPIADIGLTGAVVKEGNNKLDAFQITVGGSLGKESAFGYKLKGKVNEHRIVDVLSSMLEYYIENANKNELFYQFVNRVGIEEFQKIIDKSI